ncbi:hypothetical protein ACXWRW_11885, partial [Streptococcus pyogenes]
MSLLCIDIGGPSLPFSLFPPFPFLPPLLFPPPSLLSPFSPFLSPSFSLSSSSPFSFLSFLSPFSFPPSPFLLSFSLSL